ncbi:Transcriptional regulator, contains XRE-family HTH domain [Pseudomonas peli]|uniref:Transcriptional regulator, contains XRE-family HTH domain n=1 Tax=Pseudomonas peli TaxID=592361 RepID=A0AB37ZCL1_9PSED|nr:helix-turn-helix transcriptional regulator [Pseudomonas peli]NMZ71231.1 helix-turn-helix transcriptional regulator [Pseudomonas peli]SCW86662.1 Transcriptional regulator, contains XRE-family HTH domain [Pseudomonas peli]
MDGKQAFGEALRRARKGRHISQEAFSEISSRTYISTLERGLKSPTLEKIEALASVLELHPLTLLASYYMIKDPGSSVLDILGELRSQMTNPMNVGHDS